MSEETSEQTVYRLGELAKMAAVSTDTLRHYERIGLLTRPERTANGYRQYPVSALSRLRLIRSALAIGFSLDELTTILRTRDRGGAPCREVRELAARKLTDLEHRIVEMQEMRVTLRDLLADWDVRLATLPRGVRAALLETLTLHHNSPESNPGRLRRRKKEVG